MRAVFLSYARTDRARIETLSEDLQLLGHQVWFDRELTGGVHWWEGILKAIASADVFIFVASRDAAESVACRRELEYALALGLPILPVAMDGLDRIGALPPFIESLQIVDYSHATKADAINLARALAALPPRGALPDPLPDPPPWPASPISALHYEARSDAPMSFEAQSAWLLRLRDAVGAGDPGDSAREALAQLMQRRDLYRMTGQEADKLAAEWREAARRKSVAESAAGHKAASAKQQVSNRATAETGAAVGAIPVRNMAEPHPVLERLRAQRQATLDAEATAARLTSSRKSRFRFWADLFQECVAVTVLPVLAFLVIAAFDVRRGFWMTDSLLAPWKNSGQAGPLSDSLLLIAGAIVIVLATRIIEDKQICVDAKDRWVTSMFGVPLALFIGLTVAGLLVDSAHAYAAAHTAGGALLVHLLTQLYLVVFD